MKHKIQQLIDQLACQHSLTRQEYAVLIKGQTPESSEYVALKADKIRREIYGNAIYIRGLIEISNVCRNDCYYCGIRRSNSHCDRYRLTQEQILSCCREGYQLGFRTFVLQGGEDSQFSVKAVCSMVQAIKGLFHDCAVTLSLGEYSRQDYQAMFDAGADRYLLRHETADKEHYEKLHPPQLSFENRMRCLYDLKEIGFQTGCGFMVGSPYQTADLLAKDLKFVEGFSPDMCGIGPFIPHKDTPFGNMPPGTADQTIYLLSILRLIKPNLLLPATTALGTIQPNGREKGILAGANVIMPNLSPPAERKKYALYDNKLSTGEESAQNIALLKKHMEQIGYTIVTDKGDVKKCISNQKG